MIDKKKALKIVLEAVKQKGLALKYADESIKKDREIVLEAVKQNGWALEEADESLKNKKEIVLAAVKQDCWAFQFAGEELQKDKSIVLPTIKKQVKKSKLLQTIEMIRNSIHESLKDDPDIIKTIDSIK